MDELERAREGIRVASRTPSSAVQERIDSPRPDAPGAVESDAGSVPDGDDPNGVARPGAGAEPR